MTIHFISIDTHKVSKEFLSRKIDINILTKSSRSFVYGIEDDIYFLSPIPTIQMKFSNKEFICKTQDEFIQKVEQIKLLKLLNQ